MILNEAWTVNLRCVEEQSIWRKIMGWFSKKTSKQKQMDALCSDINRLSNKVRDLDYDRIRLSGRVVELETSAILNAILRQDQDYTILDIDCNYRRARIEAKKSGYQLAGSIRSDQEVWIKKAKR